MSMTPKENFLNYISGKPFEWFPNAMEDYNSSFLITGLDERSPNNRDGQDWYGCSWVYDPVNDACVIDVTKPYVLSDITNWREEITFPDLNKIDLEACAKADGVDTYDPDKVTYFMLQEGPFERLHSLMSFEDAFIAMMEEPEEVSALFDRIMEVKLDCLDALKKYWKADVVCMHDDWGSQQNLFFPPDMWRELIKPQIKKAVDRCHELGMKFEMHTCGMVEKILPELPEIGVDGVQIMGINNVAAMKKITGSAMSYSVSVDYQKMAALDCTGELDEALVRKIVRDEIEKYFPGGRYFAYAVPIPSWFLEIENDEVKKLSRELLGKAGYND